MWPHTGSWGTPDFGITERIGDLFGSSRTSQGGSNLYGNQSANSGDVNGASTQMQYSQPAGPVYSGPVNRPSTGGGTPTPTNNTPTPTAPSFDEGAFQRELDAAYNPSMDYLNQAESTLRADQANVNNEIAGQFNTNKQLATDKKTSSLNQVAQQETAGTRRKEDALSSARRLYDEITRGSQQRFGGSSSAGEAAFQLAGREAQRNFGQVKQGFNDFMTQIEGKRQEIDQAFNTNLMQLEQQKQSAINEAQRAFSEKLLQISNNRAALGQAKAQARLDALQQLRNNVFAIQQQTLQFNQALQLQRQQAELQLGQLGSQLAGANQGATDSFNAFTSNTTTNPQTSLAMGNNVGTPVNPQTQMIGQIRRPEDQMIGQITPTAMRDRLSMYGLA